MLKILENENEFFWLINGKLKPGLGIKSNLGDLAEFLLKEFNIPRSDYGPIKFSLNDEIYENFELSLADIGIHPGNLIIVEFTTFKILDKNSALVCTLRARDHYTEYPDGIRFQLSSVDKCKFLLEQCLAKTRQTGSFYVNILEYRLAKANNEFEIRAIQETIDKIQSLNISYLSEIRSNLEKI